MNENSADLAADSLKNFVLAGEQAESKPAENKQPEKKNTEIEITGTEEDLLSLFSGVDNILNSTSEEMVPPSAPISPENAAANSALETFLGVGAADAFSREEMPFGNLFGEETNTEPQEDADVLKILEGLEGIDLELDEDNPSVDGNNAAANSAIESFMGQQSAGTAERTTEKKNGKKDKKKGGFWSKLSLILFGEDEEEEEDGKSKKTIIGSDDAMEIEMIDIGIDNADNLALFGESVAAPTKEEKGKNCSFRF